MTMSIFPPHIITPLQNFLKVAKTMTFLFPNPDSETLKCLFRTLSNNNVRRVAIGCFDFDDHRTDRLSNK